MNKSPPAPEVMSLREIMSSHKMADSQHPKEGGQPTLQPPGTRVAYNQAAQAWEERSVPKQWTTARAYLSVSNVPFRWHGPDLPKAAKLSLSATCFLRWHSSCQSPEVMLPHTLCEAFQQFYVSSCLRWIFFLNTYNSVFLGLNLIDISSLTTYQNNILIVFHHCTLLVFLILNMIFF